MSDEPDGTDTREVQTIRFHESYVNSDNVQFGRAVALTVNSLSSSAENSNRVIYLPFSMRNDFDDVSVIDTNLTVNESIVRRAIMPNVSVRVTYTSELVVELTTNDAILFFQTLP